MAKQLKILFIADIVGESGMSLMQTLLPGIIEKYKADFVIVNAENAHEGRGLNENIVKRLYDLGVNVITGGNHSFDKWKIFGYMKTDDHLLRPLNYPKGNPGFGYGIYETTAGIKVGVVNLQGRTFMQAIDDPFSTAEWIVEKILRETPIIFIDFHAEATAEKMALGWELDGRVSLLVGTHTHVPTSDARILPEGTGYVTDAGMTGPFDSVIGMDTQTSVLRFTRSTPQRFKVATDDNRLCGIIAEVDTTSGNCLSIESIIFPSFQSRIQ